LPGGARLFYRRTVKRAGRALLLVAALSGSARAQDSAALAASNARFDEGKRLLKEGKVAEACTAFDESQRLVPRGGTLLNLGLCHEQEGKLVLARRELVEARALAQSQNKADRVTLASEHLSAIDARLSWLELVPPPNVDQNAVVLSVDGVALERTTWQAVPLEAGRHVVAAEATGFKRRELEVSLGQAPERRSLRFDPLEPATGQVAPPPPLPPPTQAAPEQDRSASTLKTAALIAGIAGTAISLGTGIYALERKGVVRDHCDDDKLCDDEGLDAASTGRALVITSTVAFAVGAVGFAAWFMLPDGPAAQPMTGFTVRGSF
jgi:hypothetical protein